MSPTKDAPNVLVVDDESDICDNLRDILADLGYNVDTANDGRSALKLVEAKHYDVALLDLRMPGMDGLELHRRIKALRPGAVAMIVTAYATDAATQAALEAGAWKVVAKPVDFSRLMQWIGEALDQPIVLVIDDDDELCQSLWDILREQGYRVSLAGNGVQAAQRLKEHDPQVVLIDMKLPLTSGAEIFRLVRKTNPQARTVLITGHRREVEREIDEAIREGADAVCYKPFDVERLLKTVRELSQSKAGS
jgi:DNA-binding NtrC family response regulator